jgi:hypothetical protein
MEMVEWERKHAPKIDEFVRKNRKSYHTYYIKHTYRAIPPRDQFILQYSKYNLSYEPGKLVDTVVVQHYIRK